MEKVPLPGAFGQGWPKMSQGLKQVVLFEWKWAFYLWKRDWIIQQSISEGKIVIVTS